MDLQTFKFPEVTGADRAFPTFKAIPELLAEAKARGFYDGDTPYNKLFADLFYKGGRIKFKPGVDEDFQNRAWSYCRAFMSSWEPSHEDKAAIAALIMSEVLEPELQIA